MYGSKNSRWLNCETSQADKVHSSGASKPAYRRPLHPWLSGSSYDSYQAVLHYIPTADRSFQCSALLIYAMQHSPWEANRFSASQEIPQILWTPKVHCSLHKCPPPVPILYQLDPPHPTSWKNILIFSSHLRLGLPSGLLPLDFPTETPYNLLPYLLHAPPISFFSILSPEQYWMSSTDH